MSLIEVKIPPMGESITSGVLARWHVKNGDTVKKDQPLFELETDKITSEGTAEAAGTISLKVAVGAEVKIGELVATIETAGGGSAPASAPAASAAPAAGAGGQSSAAQPASAPAGAVATGPATDGQSPAVRRIATETGVDPAGVAGTGKAGRVTKGDMLSAGNAPGSSGNPSAPSQGGGAASAQGAGGAGAAGSPNVGGAQGGGGNPSAPSQSGLGASGSGVGGGGGASAPSQGGFAASGQGAGGAQGGGAGAAGGAAGGGPSAAATNLSLNPTPSPGPAGAGPERASRAVGPRQTTRKLSPLRQRIAQRLVAAQHEAAMLTTFNEVDMSAVMALRAKYQDDFVKKNGVKLGFMSFFTKAVVHALREVPAVNAQIDGDTLIENHFYDIGVAVSTEKGLMVPVIRNCETLTMAEIEKTIGDAAKRARDGKITLADLEGGVFTITNGGIFGSMLSTPIINPPQSAILGLHAINDRPIALNGQVVVRPMMYLALSYDHRLVDGRQAVTFLVKVKQAIEDPTRLLLSV